MCLCLFSCGDEDEIPEGMKLASDTEIVDYKLYVPIDWTVSNATATTQAYCEDRTNINIAQWDSSKTVDEWWKDEYKPQVFEAGAVTEATIEKNKDGSEGKSITLDKKAAKQYDYTAKIGDSFFKYTVIACKTGGSIYVIHITYMQDSGKEGDEVVFSSVEKHKDDIKNILDNFKFE